MPRSRPSSQRSALHRLLPSPSQTRLPQPKLSPNSEDIVAVARAVADAGADFVTLTNTVWGLAIDVETGAPRLSGQIGGYSGRAIKPIALRCVWEVAASSVPIPIVGCGGVWTGEDVVEYLMAGASAVRLGTVHFAEARAGRRILQELEGYCERHEVDSVARLVGSAHRGE